MTVNLPPDLIEEAKRAFWLDLRTVGEHEKFAGWVAAALRDRVEATKATHGVDELPARPHRLPPGRPLS